VNLPYLSDEFLDAVRFANDKARELGMRVDITLGSGWPYGGPHTPVDLASGEAAGGAAAVPANARNVAMPKSARAKSSWRRLSSAARIRTRHRYRRRRHCIWPPEALPAALLVFIASRTRQAVKRAAVGAEGPVLDHYSAAAIENHLK
jgi:hypothetical protein